jgi:3-hydroxyisobutyrate dehydrogenase-like beta-hydroxyacid dehydrogenase
MGMSFVRDVAIVGGCGRVGLPLGLVLADAGLTVTLYDRDAEAVDRVRARGGKIVHIDVTVVCEAPRIAPHRDAMRARIAAVAGIAAGRVGVKATTSEKMGFIGRSEGMAAFANATVRLPWSSD